MIYYTRTLKTGERYTTSYKDTTMAKKIANQETTSTSKSLWDGELFFDMNSGNSGPKVRGVALVSRIQSNGQEHHTAGRYGIFNIVDEKPNDLGLRFTTYGEANKFVRAVIGSYEELFVLELEKTESGKKTVQQDLELSSEFVA